MESFIPCVGCGEPLFGSPCRWCTCVQCGNDIHNGSCLFCGSRNSFDYDPNPNSFNDSSNFSNYPPQPDFSNCCEYCGGPHPSFECQTGNMLVYEHNPCNNYDYSYHDQPPQYQTIQTQPLQSPQELLQICLDTLKDLKELLKEESRQKTYAEEQAARVSSQYWKPLVYDYDDDDDDDDFDEESTTPSGNPTPVSEPFISDSSPSLTPVERSEFLLEEVDDPISLKFFDPEDSLIMEDDHLSTISETKSSSVESFVPIPSESEDVSDSDWDLHVCDSLDISEVTSGIFSNPLFESNDDYTFCEVNPLFDEMSDSDTETITEVVEIASSQSTPLVPPLYSIFSLPSCEDDSILTDEIHDPKVMNSPSEDEELVMIVIMIFFLFFIYSVTSPVLHSFGNEDIIFDPGISMYHF